MKVLICDGLSEKGLEILRNTQGLEVDAWSKISREELLSTIKDYHAMVVRSATKVTAEVIEEAKNLKVIGRAGIGVDNIDIDAATKRGIVVMNTPEGNVITTAEHTIAMLVALARKIPQACISMKGGKWEKKRFQGTELYNKTLGIVGVGKIGSIVAERAQGLKMNVIAYDPYLSEERANKLGIELVSLDELLAFSDFISIHVPLSQETRNMFNAKLFSKMKTGVRIINCARGGIVNEDDLYDAIKSGKVAGAALDVFETEPPKDTKLLSLEEVIATPHLGASTLEAQEKVGVAIAEQIVDYLTRGIIRNSVNVPSVSPEVLSVVAPYLNLAEKLGSLQAQLCKGGITEVTMEYSGEVVEQDVSPITIAGVKGILDQILDQYVNFVNAPLIAQERGIKVVEIKSSKPIDFASSITIKVKTKDEKENIVEGALFGKNDPRIVRINKFLLDAVPVGYILILQNLDKPGVIGNVGTLLSSYNINIARVHLGRESTGGEAMSFWNIDTPPTEEVMEKLTNLPHILSAQLVKL